jgi:hypothetical protein
MTAKLLKLVASRPSEKTDCVRAMPSAPATHAAHEARLRGLRHTVSVRIASATIRPVFTTRTHYGAPKAPGHRQFTGPQRGWE